MPFESTDIDDYVWSEGVNNTSGASLIGGKRIVTGIFGERIVAGVESRTAGK